MNGTARRSNAVLLAPLYLLACVAPALTPSTAYADELDWERVAAVRVIEVVTTDEDGDDRETKVWFVLIDGVPYLRTNDSRWLENIRRDPGVVIRIDEIEYVHLAHEVTTPELIEQVDAATRAKYGWQEATIHVFRIGEPEILRLSRPD
jgi:hypothetical protein